MAGDNFFYTLKIDKNFFLKHPYLTSFENLKVRSKYIALEPCFIVTRFKIFFNKNTTLPTQFFEISEKDFFLFHLSLKSILYSNYFLIDLTCNSIQVTSVLSNLPKNNFLVTTVKNTTSIDSLSPIFRSAVWLERELKEFSNIFVKSLIDIRRLLTDYCTYKDAHQVYKTNSYNLKVQELLRFRYTDYFYLGSILSVFLLVFLY